jgi:hypothetical protein
MDGTTGGKSAENRRAENPLIPLADFPLSAGAEESAGVPPGRRDRVIGPRAIGTNPRATGMNPRLLGDNERSKARNKWALRNWKRNRKGCRS